MKCDQCPVRPALACVGEHHPPVCRDVAGGMPGRAEQLVAVAERKARPPGPLAMAASLGRAVVAHVADGMRTASPEAQGRRAAICGACEHNDPVAGKCRLCGCLAMDLKRSWPSSVCPDSPPRWGPEP